jgi:hypothetical protein
LQYADFVAIGMRNSLHSSRNESNTFSRSDVAIQPIAFIAVTIEIALPLFGFRAQHITVLFVSGAEAELFTVVTLKSAIRVPVAYRHGCFDFKRRQNTHQNGAF